MNCVSNLALTSFSISFPQHFGRRVWGPGGDVVVLRRGEGSFWGRCSQLYRCGSSETAGWSDSILSTQFFWVFWSVDVSVSVTQSNVSFLARLGRELLLSLLTHKGKFLGLYSIIQGIILSQRLHGYRHLLGQFFLTIFIKLMITSKRDLVVSQRSFGV